MCEIADMKALRKDGNTDVTTQKEDFHNCSTVK